MTSCLRQRKTKASGGDLDNGMAGPIPTPTTQAEPTRNLLAGQGPRSHAIGKPTLALPAEPGTTGVWVDGDGMDSYYSRSGEGASISMGDTMPSDEDRPYRFTLPMKASLLDKAAKEQAIGSPIRWRIENDVMLQGVIVDWIDLPDGNIDLIVEVDPSQSQQV